MLFVKGMEYLLHTISKIKRVLERRKWKIQHKLEECVGFEDIRQKGELLKNVPGFKKGMKQVTVTDYYSKDLKEVTINIHPALGLFENAERYFKKARKLKKAYPFQKKRLDEADRTLSLVTEIEQKVTNEKLPEDQVKDRLKRLGFARFFPEFNKPRNMKERKHVLRKFISSDGCTIYVGRNAEDNDYVTFHIGKGKDLWLHVSGYKGSHVLVKVDKAKQCPQNTVKEAAALAIYYSKARNNFRVDVTCSPVCNVRRASRRTPGLVTAANPKYVKASKHALEQILAHQAENRIQEDEGKNS